MIYALIDYLINQPSETTSPLYLAVNTPAMLATQGGVITSIPVFDTRALKQSENVPPYVRISYNGEFSLLQNAINNGVLYQTNVQAATIECAATGVSPFQASQRAEKLKLAVLARIALSKSYVMAGALSLTDDGGTGSTFKISDFMFEPIAELPGPSGPGASLSSQSLTKIARMRLKVFVEYSLRS